MDLTDLIPTFEEGGVVLIILIALLILFTKVLLVDTTTIVVVMVLIPILWILLSKAKVKDKITNEMIFEKFQALGSPSGLQLEPDLILLFDRLGGMAPRRGDSDDISGTNQNVVEAAKHAAEVLKVHNYIQQLDETMDVGVLYQNALSHTKDCINAIHSTIYTANSDEEGQFILKILTTVQEILDPKLVDIQKWTNNQFRATNSTIKSQFIEPKKWSQQLPDISTFDYY